MSGIESFTLHCTNPYDRHDYKLVYEDGREVVFDNYEDIQLTWFQRRGNFLSHVEVIDKNNKKKKGGGFK